MLFWNKKSQVENPENVANGPITPENSDTNAPNGSINSGTSESRSK